jgi:hypothetical protein
MAQSSIWDGVNHNGSRQGDRFGAALALLWPLAVLVIQIFLNLFGVIGSAFARRNLCEAELGAVQNRFIGRAFEEGWV